MLNEREQALKDGYRDEICPVCEVMLEAQIHFVRCEYSKCPMISKEDGRTLLQRWAGEGHERI
jgi:hypothetical protein